jgi:hypothetical protein
MMVGNPRTEVRSMGAFGRRIEEQDAIECPRLEALGIRLYAEARENGELCIQIRQNKPAQRRLKSVAMGQLGEG